MIKTKLAVLAAAVLASGLAMSAPNDGRKTYIVQLTDEPAVTYQGGVAGLAATRVAAGSKFEFQRSEVQAYVGHLRRQQSAVARFAAHPCWLPTTPCSTASLLG